MSDVVALAGGVGGSKFAFGLQAHLGDRLTVIVNTGDDETMYGLRVCPDLDTMRYTLSGLANPETGWGVSGDTFNALDQLRRYGIDAWFQIGDRDLATDLARTQWLNEGHSLTEVEAELCRRSGVAGRILPMCDEPVATRVTTPDGELDFQEYFVRRRHQDPVKAIVYRGVERARLSNEVRTAVEDAKALLLCPSNPVVSIGPVLAVPGLRSLLQGQGRPVAAVSPIVGGEAVSGPAGGMMAALGYEVSVLGLAAMYRGLITGLAIDQADASREPALRDLGLQVLVTDTIMRTADDKRRLAGEVLRWLELL